MSHRPGPPVLASSLPRPRARPGTFRPPAPATGLPAPCCAAGMIPPSACPARLALARMDPRPCPQRRKAPACVPGDLPDVFPALPRPASRPLRPVPAPLCCAATASRRSRRGSGRELVRLPSPMHAVEGRTPPDTGLPCYVPRDGATHTEATVRRLVRLSCLGPGAPGTCVASPRTAASGRFRASSGPG